VSPSSPWSKGCIRARWSRWSPTSRIYGFGIRCEVARRTRHLTRAQAQEVDAAVAEQIAALSWGRFLAVLDAAVIAADPVVAEERRRAAEEHRFVRTGRTSEHGLATLIARAAAGDVLVFDAAVGRVAAMLAAFGNPESLDVRRSQALGILGDPVRALAFFADYTTAVANHTIEPFPDDDPLDRPNPTHHPYDDDTHSGDPAWSARCRMTRSRMTRSRMSRLSPTVATRRR
jgi:hypothetical protein